MRNKSREAFRNEWKYLISTSEKEMLMLRLKPFLQPDPHAGEGGYYIRSLYFEDYWNSGSLCIRCMRRKQSMEWLV